MAIVEIAFIIIGVIFLAGGWAFFVWSKKTQQKIRQVLSVEASTVSELNDLYSKVAEEVEKGYFGVKFKASGTVECDSPLTSELTQQKCVYYTMKVERKWEEERQERRKDEKGNVYYETVTHKGSDTVGSNTRATDFWLKNHTRRILVHPEGAEFDPVKIYDKFKPADAVESGRIPIGPVSITLPTRVSHGGRRTTGYHLTESIIPVEKPIFIIGWASDQKGELSIQKPPNEGLFLISHKSEKQYVSNLQGQKRSLLILSGITAIVGVVLTAAGLMI